MFEIIFDNRKWIYKKVFNIDVLDQMWLEIQTEIIITSTKVWILLLLYNYQFHYDF